jgi:preprotein translocase subunit SecD
VSVKSSTRPWRALIAILVITLAMGVGVFWPGTSSSAKLGLDLQGGTQVILTPRIVSGAPVITADQLNQTVAIMRQRVNGFGVAEAEVAVQGSGNEAAIVVSVPGVNQQGIAELLKQTALLEFRPVLQARTSSAPVEDTSATAPAPVIIPTSAGSEAELAAAFAGAACFSAEALQGGAVLDPNSYVVTCSTDGAETLLLAPTFIAGERIDDAMAALPPQGGTGAWVVTLDFDSAGATALATASTDMSAKPDPLNRFGIVLDGLVVSAPFFQEPILGGSAQISGSFTPDEAKALASVLRYGALPIALDIAETNAVSPTLGIEQLNAGLLAGALGLSLVVLYLLLYYRLLGLVAIVSLALAASMIYFAVVLLGRSVGFTLTLAGVAGLIVSIGITADSFVVYNERIRDEIRDGKAPRAAIDAAWKRARRTLLAADFVQMLAAVVLYFLSVGAVQGFAFALGLSTLVDVFVAFWFTRPVTVLFGKSRFANGKLSGISPSKLRAGIPANLVVDGVSK